MKLFRNLKLNGIDSYSKETGLSADLLLKAFKIENSFHIKLKREKCKKKREILYKDFYHKLLNFYGRDSNEDDLFDKKIELKNKQIFLFKKELYNKSIIDFGCGEGFFLKNIEKKLKHKSLFGVDIFIPSNLSSNSKINFIETSIINFSTDKKFDVAFSDNVLEHISVLDYPDHLQTVYNSLKSGGKFILVVPNRLFGPSDISRIFDNSSSGKTSAIGGHLNESTYHEMINFLKNAGFVNFRTALPIPYLKFFPLLNKIRIKTNIITFIERNPFLLKIFRLIKYKGRCKIRFTITLICQKPFN